ncbi:uncharacterized protein LOC117115114 [Anneissia japonica]|uniref:uncharacterized protein LOC117115114 n=1 Tax=Anneissia japonica TaxID=1529436 RepID=UPI0014255AEE|nr:uncharacterized protein LOC117115114 [Anneissia japonica]XP_033114695.1 uncharacterized protein LOC117115114 [Anneissia japonica]
MIPLVVFFTAIIVSSALPLTKQESAYWQKIVDQHTGLDPNEIAAKVKEEFSNNGLVPSAGQAFEDVDWQRYLNAGEEINNGQDFDKVMEGKFSNNELVPSVEQSITYVDWQKDIEAGEEIRNLKDLIKMRADMMGHLTLNQGSLTKSPWLNGMPQTKYNNDLMTSSASPRPEDGDSQKYAEADAEDDEEIKKEEYVLKKIYRPKFHRGALWGRPTFHRGALWG